MWVLFESQCKTKDVKTMMTKVMTAGARTQTKHNNKTNNGEVNTYSAIAFL
jgi:hypothetical protein